MFFEEDIWEWLVDTAIEEFSCGRPSEVLQAGEGTSNRKLIYFDENAKRDLFLDTSESSISSVSASTPTPSETS